MTQTIVSYIERDITYMKNEINKLNHPVDHGINSSTTRIVEELD
jgi:hypothetical protein